MAVYGSALDWPTWIWFLLPTLGAGSLLVDLQLQRSVDTAFPDEEDAGTEPVDENPYRETSVSVVPVLSSVADCPFLFSATISWRFLAPASTEPHGNPGALAVNSLLDRVRRVTSMEHPSHHTFLERELEGVLGAPLPDASGLVTAFATDVRLVLRKKDQDYLEELDSLKKAISAWESRREHERNLREYLGDDVLQSPGDAVVWWLARHDDQIERAVEMIAPLTVLSAAANNEQPPERYRNFLSGAGHDAEPETGTGFGHPEPVDDEPAPVHTAEDAAPPEADQRASQEHLSAWMDGLGFEGGTAERAAFLHRIAVISEAAGRTDAAENIRREARGGVGEEPPGPLGGPLADEGRAGPVPEARGPRRSGWQVSPEGVVDEAEGPGARDFGMPRERKRDPEPAGEER
ncbi:hypothetical protein ACIQRS_30095 [Streptomyces termitum]|uniref:hypothetical protein n=1 Tax=Streptomyces termitum TaxID=67368 RepID=UPI00382E513F